MSTTTEPDDDPRRDDREDFGYWQRRYRREPALKARVLDGSPHLKPGWFRLVGVDGRLRVIRGPRGCGYMLFARLRCATQTALHADRTLLTLVHAAEVLPLMAPAGIRVIKYQARLGYAFLCPLVSPAIYKIEYHRWGGSTLYWHDGSGEVNPDDLISSVRREEAMRSLRR